MISWSTLSFISQNNPKIMESFEVDLNEKRSKATLSEPLKIETLTAELDSYYNDRLPFRSILIYYKILNFSGHPVVFALQYLL